MWEFRFYPAAAVLAVLAFGAAAETIDPAREYSSCLAMANTSPQEAFDRAQRWEGLGGGEAARHCAAAALFGLGKYAEAGKRLEALAQESRREVPVRAGMLRQAGRAWFMAHETDRAYAVQSAALKLAPGDPQLLVDRAATLAEGKDYRESIADLDLALKAEPERPDALLFRASAYRLAGETASAQRDIDRLLRLNPGNVDGLLERGILARLAGHADAARRDWMRILFLDPPSPAADAARRNIERMDVAGAGE
ncbi:MAG: hypothetical protein HQL33_01115 [Alphaproteobacteria bacterium]|nr:hypothetical protein [Alphaproteobacteria bacterium]